MKGKSLPNVDSHHDVPLNRRTCYFDIIGEWRPHQDSHLEPQPLEAARAVICYTLRAIQMVGHPGYAPDVSPSQAARISIFLVPEKLMR